jgi:hypothetical protein
VSECEDCEQLDYAAIVSDAMRVERERIIKLLMKSSIELRYWDGEKARLIEHYTHTAEEAEAELRALINGETNDK